MVFRTAVHRNLHGNRVRKMQKILQKRGTRGKASLPPRVNNTDKSALKGRKSKRVMLPKVMLPNTSVGSSGCALACDVEIAQRSTDKRSLNTGKNRQTSDTQFHHSNVKRESARLIRATAVRPSKSEAEAVVVGGLLTHLSGHGSHTPSRTSGMLVGHDSSWSHKTRGFLADDCAQDQKGRVGRHGTHSSALHQDSRQ